MMTIRYESPRIVVTTERETRYVWVWELMRQGYVKDDEIARAILAPGTRIECIRDGCQA